MEERKKEGRRQEKSGNGLRGRFQDPNFKTEVITL
jgi:hypothetical protein